MLLLLAISPSAWCLSAATALHEADITTLQAEMDAGRLSSHELVEHFLRRIDALDRHGPTLNSVIELNPDALTIADRLDAERLKHGPRSAMHGIPILLKDNIDTADRMHTSAGSLALMNDRPSEDASIVQRLRDAGAVILGKTNLSEWANFRSSRSSSGWSGRGGQTLNPYDPARSPCGSSSGSGVAVAAGFAVVAIGTETDGSIVCPSSVNGIVGIKPTIGLVSRRGIVPISASQDTAGPMARSVADAAIVLAVIAGADAEDPATDALNERSIPDYPALLKDRQALRGARIGVARDLAGFHEGVDVVFEQAIVALRAAGAVIVDPANLELDESLGDDEFTVLLYEFKDGLAHYLATRPEAPQDLGALIDYNRAHPQQEMPYFRQELFLAANEKASLDSPEYLKAKERAQRLAGPDGIDAAIRRHRLDALIAPTVGAAWTIDLVNGDHYPGGNASTAPAVSGYPHITVPAGYLHGLPVGVSFFGPAWSEPSLLQFANDYEHKTNIRQTPMLPGPAP
ncbi:amidase [Algiphilus sp. W345]|uniref:Amidase n=1 Tax=Banduia mediterranea TaxID=3075609 RepID=A0ABU2WD16_9GAMM|nr:amidase [Algiphilus sp. W345]MDT0495776.1 amidase [Algiphilus sp. W345]